MSAPAEESYEWRKMHYWFAQCVAIVISGQRRGERCGKSAQVMAEPEPTDRPLCSWHRHDYGGRR
jgi:hypothetical protein